MPALFLDRQKKPAVRIHARRKGTSPLFPAEYLLFSVEHSAGRLRYVQWEPPVPYDGMTPGALMLDERPLVMVQDSGCPTCASLLAAGYGRPADDPTLRAAADRLAVPYTSLEDALERLAPITGLLLPGTYVLSRQECFPTDGEGRFFWAVPPGYGEYAATAWLYDHVNYSYLPALAGFLYPTQPPDKLDEARVEFYRQKLRAGETLPPILAYTIPSGYGTASMSTLLDGHHRAAACALEGKTVPCLSLSTPLFGYREKTHFFVWPDNTREPCPETLKSVCLERREGVPDKLPHGGVERAWPEEYRQAVEQFPTAWEAGCLGRYPDAVLNETGIRKLANTYGPTDELEQETAATLLEYAARQPETDGKSLAMAFLGKEECMELREAAYRVLDRIKDDPEVDGLFIDLLVNEERESPLWRIADGHWD